MSEIENSKFAENLSDQIDLLEVFFVLVKGIRFIASVTIFFNNWDYLQSTITKYLQIRSFVSSG